MKRHNHYCTFEGVESDAEPRVEGDGEWVRYEDAMAALAAERERLFGAMLSMPNLMHACDALGVPANGEYCDLLRRALYRA